MSARMKTYMPSLGWFVLLTCITGILVPVHSVLEFIPIVDRNHWQSNILWV
ncbi:hypothetical protein NMYAN_150063 [Nitrosomonas nitrosa]|uniref:Uncharacterized protein n=1 Tax=Nitrosomonas nitrosa TaxID=52442 RepID=A0A8H8YY05_9PROT|nr:hypothetical protein NMYAN_150063 [Nitrosomonas nitrosa]